VGAITRELKGRESEPQIGITKSKESARETTTVGV
jgi:hypothetical protein